MSSPGASCMQGAAMATAGSPDGSQKLAVGVLSWRCPTRIERSREKQRMWGFHGCQVVVHDHSEQGCALVGLCLSMCEVGVRVSGVCEL